VAEDNSSVAGAHERELIAANTPLLQTSRRFHA
jgi:hypothetical protein